MSSVRHAFVTGHPDRGVLMTSLRRLLLGGAFIAVVTLPATSAAQNGNGNGTDAPKTPRPAHEAEKKPDEKKEAKKEHWYDRLNIRGYTQLRYSRLLGDGQITSPNDRSIGGNSGFLIRRARVILFGDVHPQLSVYLQ